MGEVKRLSEKDSNEAEAIFFNDSVAVWKDIIDNWKIEFTERIKTSVNSKKQGFDLIDAFKRCKGITKKVDEVMIRYCKFVSSSPLTRNDYYKYLVSYQQGKKLDDKYFRHDLRKLKDYYRKFDKEGIEIFSQSKYERYVLFMMLKLEGLYIEGYNDIFNVKQKDHREYNPLTGIPSVLRGELPIDVIEFDIRRAFPTFIDNELSFQRKNDVYDIIDKKKFNTALNLHSGVKGSTIEKTRSILRIVYSDRVNEVVTEERFFNQGAMFNDLVKYEHKAINKFVKANHLQNYVRLHDGVFVKKGTVCNQMEVEGIAFAIKECIKPEITNEIINFYAYGSDGSLITSPKKYHDFFIQEGLIRATDKGNDKVIIFNNTNKVIEPMNHKTDSVPFLKLNINELITDEVENRIANDNRNVIPGGFLLMQPVPLEYYQDERDSFGLAFKNGFYLLSKMNEDIQRKDYNDVNGFFPPHSTQSHEFSYTDELGDFEHFVTMVSTGKDNRKYRLSEQDKNTVYRWCSMIGYCVHGYKDPSKTIAHIFSDMGANDESRNGGRGKTILANALGYVQKSITKGGNEFDPKYTHNFADLDQSHRIYIIDDVPPSFPFDAIYTNITGDISCQLKGSNAVTILKEKTPKFIITTNWSVRYDDEADSTNRRFNEWQFTDFFNIKKTPRDVFGRSFFTDWDNLEWNRFYSFIYRCVRQYFNEGLRPMHYDKSEDNFRANFNNDALYDEFVRVFKIINVFSSGFSVSDFLNEYLSPQNNLRYEKWFHKNNVKTLVNAYIKKNKLNFNYVSREKKWVEVDSS